MTTASPSQSPPTQTDLAQQLWSDGIKARDLAKATFPKAMARALHDPITFMNACSWIGDPKHLRDLIADINALALDVRVARRLAELHPDLHRSLVDDVLRSLLAEAQKKQGKAA